MAGVLIRALPGFTCRGKPDYKGFVRDVAVLFCVFFSWLLAGIVIEWQYKVATIRVNSASLHSRPPTMSCLLQVLPCVAMWTASQPPTCLHFSLKNM